MILDLEGDPGPKGDPGPQGNGGFLSGSTDPISSDGVEGDFYINSTSSMIFGPKNNGVWPDGISLIGEKGEEGISAYELWQDQGNIGTQTDFINSLKGDEGSQGKNNYEIWLDEGNTGTLDDFFSTLRGQRGQQGLKGDPGSNASVTAGTGVAGFKYW